MHKNLKLILVIVILASSKLTLAQLTIKDLFYLSSHSDFEMVNDTLIKKGFEFFNSEIADSTYGKITWTYKKNKETDNAYAWVFLIIDNEGKAYIKYLTGNIDEYKKLKNSFPLHQLKSVGTRLENNHVNSEYSNSYFTIIVETEKNYIKKYNDSTAYNAYIFNVTAGANINGIKKTYYNNGLIKAMFEEKNGKCNGFYKTYYKNGNLESECQYVNNVRNGPAREFHENGTIKGKYMRVNDKYDGPLYIYNEDGLLNTEILMKNGKQNGYAKIYFPQTGQIGLKGFYKDGEKDSVWTSYSFEPYRSNSITNYKNGKENGPFKLIRKDINSEGDTIAIEVEGTYLNGSSHGHFKYFEIIGDSVDIQKLITSKNRKLISEGDFKNDLKDGLWKWYDANGNISIKEFVDGQEKQ
ncbi:MAG: hypothetical protein ABI723_03360 [Bacteroidia bacterium]